MTYVDLPTHCISGYKTAQMWNCPASSGHQRITAISKKNCSCGRHVKSSPEPPKRLGAQSRPERSWYKAHGDRFQLSDLSIPRNVLKILLKILLEILLWILLTVRYSKLARACAIYVWPWRHETRSPADPLCEPINTTYDLRWNVAGCTGSPRSNWQMHLHHSAATHNKHTLPFNMIYQ